MAAQKPEQASFTPQFGAHRQAGHLLQDRRCCGKTTVRKKKNNRQKTFVVLFHPLSLNRLPVLGIIHGDISSDVESKSAVAH